MHERRPLGETVAVIHPLLALRRQQLLDYLHAGAIPYRVDSSNLDVRFTRNRLRRQLLPQLEQDYNPGIIDVLCRLAEQAREFHDDISRAAAQLLAQAELPRAGDMLVFSVPALRSASANLMREMFRRVWQREHWPMGDMDFPRWQRLVEIAQGTQSACDFPGNIHVRRVGNVMQLARPEAAVAPA
jgi:tRNA(Ile)-lysidine synthase